MIFWLGESGAMLLERWPHQRNAVADILAAFARGERRVVLQLATGGGKTVIAQDVAQEFLEVRRKRVALYTNRRMMVDQMVAGLELAGLDHGVRADGFDDEREKPFQVCSFQTEYSRVLKREQWKLHASDPGDLAIVDECHLHNGEKSVQIMRQHYDAGGCVLGLSATPLGIGQHYDVMVKAATMQELRECGALVVAHHFGCDEPDLHRFKRMKLYKSATEGEDMSQAQQVHAIMTPTIMGRVWSWYEQLNPERKPALLFGPGVEESLWFAQQFHKKGVPSAHVDGDDVWIDGRFYRADSKARESVREGHRVGSIQVVCNRYVLREGVDWPWIEHIILAFVAGNVQTYLQVGGRGLRFSPGKERLVVQDHGGCWWRHGSLNEDREWRLEFTPSIMYGLRANRQRALPVDRKAKCCPKCHQIMNRRVCLCGYEFPPGKASRPVVTMAGELKELSGDVFRPHPVCKRRDGPARWERMYWRSNHRLITKKDGTEAWVGHTRTFNAAMALFAEENYWQYPDPSWPFMPLSEYDYFELVEDVPREKLVQKEVAGNSSTR